MEAFLARQQKELTFSGNRRPQSFRHLSDTTKTVVDLGTEEVVHVQRQYETYLWTAETETSSEEKTYRINYRVEGPRNGKPIILIHGFGGNVNHFRYNIPLLAAEGYRVYAVDLLGFGAR